MRIPRTEKEKRKFFERMEVKIRNDLITAKNSVHMLERMLGRNKMAAIRQSVEDAVTQAKKHVAFLEGRLRKIIEKNRPI